MNAVSTFAKFAKPVAEGELIRSAVKQFSELLHTPADLAFTVAAMSLQRCQAAPDGRVDARWRLPDFRQSLRPDRALALRVGGIMTSRISLRRLWLTMLIVMTVTLPRDAGAQNPPPVQGTIALEGTINKFYRAANVVIVTTIDGVQHAYHFAKDLVVHGGKGTDASALEDLREGTTVVVHYAAEGSEQAVSEVDIIDGQALAVTEGTVIRIDRGRGQITLRYGNGNTDVFRLTERAATETLQSPKDGVPAGTKVVIYYSDEHGQKTAHFFRRVSR